MNRHRTDLVSLVAGLTFAGVAIAAWTGQLRLDAPLDLRWVWPVLLIAGGLSLLTGLARRDDEHAVAPSSDGRADDGAADAGWESPPADG